jgi:hypothetical protein
VLESSSGTVLSDFLLQRRRTVRIDCSRSRQTICRSMALCVEWLICRETEMKQRHLRHQSQGGRCLLCFNCRDSNSRKKKNQLEGSFAHKNPAFEVKKTSTFLTSMATSQRCLLCFNCGVFVCKWCCNLLLFCY